MTTVFYTPDTAIRNRLRVFRSLAPALAAVYASKDPDGLPVYYATVRAGWSMPAHAHEVTLPAREMALVSPLDTHPLLPLPQVSAKTAQEWRKLFASRQGFDDRDLRARTGVVRVVNAAGWRDLSRASEEALTTAYLGATTSPAMRLTIATLLFRTSVAASPWRWWFQPRTLGLLSFRLGLGAHADDWISSMFFTLFVLPILLGFRKSAPATEQRGY